MTTVLLAIDETDAAHFAALTAVSLFGPDATYLAVHVEPAAHGSTPRWGPIYGYPYPPVPVVSAMRLDGGAGTQDAINDARLVAAQQVAALGVDAAPVGEVGDPATAIGAVASEHDVDVVVLGAHQRGWFGRLFDDSVVDDLRRVSEVPLLVVPEPDLG
ncbi:MAG: universal stress protein [Ilumatobacteraceae bacterium]|nr:universal stress protein [Ilumatobacteraceae bacterium]